MGKFQTAQRLMSQNGLYWTALYALRKLFKKNKNVTLQIDTQLKNLEIKHHLPGTNTLTKNYLVWQTWDWSLKGEEWTPSDEWKQSLINSVMLKYIRPGNIVLEIGPGAGRWTETLQTISRKLICVDISDKCIELCKERFACCDNITFFVNNGKTLDFLNSETIDFVWSFDVFVHISPEDTASYLKEMSRVLKKGGIGIVHHAKKGGLRRGWRSSMTDELFLDLLKKASLSPISQFDSWGENEHFNVKYHEDTITVFRK